MTVVRAPPGQLGTADELGGEGARHAETSSFTVGTTPTEPLAQYQSVRTEMEAMWGGSVAPEPDTAAPVIMKLAALPDPPRRLIVGSQSFDHVLEMDQAQADLYRSWEHLSRIAPG